VVIVGGGYAGTTCAVKLGRLARSQRLDLDVVLVEPNPCQQALSELDLVAVGPERPEFCELWHPTVFRDLPVRVVYDRVSVVYPEHGKVALTQGDTLDYWRLVLATGAIPHLPPIPGLSGGAITMWSVEDAQRLQAASQEAMRRAAMITDPATRRESLSFVVVGGGATGVEIVGTMAQLLPRRMKAFGLDPKDLDIYLIEGRPAILYDLPERLRKVARRRLERMGVTVVTDALVSSAEYGSVRLVDGREIPAPILVWAGGAKADPHAADWGFAADPSGRLLADEYLKAPGHDDVYVIGDLSAARHPQTHRALPMLAQMAIQEGPTVAESIARESQGRSPVAFEPHLRGEFVSIGPRWGVGVMYGAQLTGLPAIIMKRITYVKYWLQVGGLRLAWKRGKEMLAMQH
jgi:NADH dehydrogenase